jgi:hypothetical protein
MAKGIIETKGVRPSFDRVMNPSVSGSETVFVTAGFSMIK